MLIKSLWLWITRPFILRQFLRKIQNERERVFKKVGFKPVKIKGKKYYIIQMSPILRKGLLSN